MGYSCLLVLVLLPTFPFALILSLLVLLVISFARLILSAPNALISQEALLLKLYIGSSMFVRLPAALKISVVNTADICVTGVSISWWILLIGVSFYGCSVNSSISRLHVTFVS